jgi:hypothetical protein
MKPGVKRRLAAVLLALVTGLAGPIISAWSQADVPKLAPPKSLDAALDSMAERLAAYQKDQVKSGISISDFRSPGGTNSGAVVRDLLTEKSKKKGVELEKPGRAAVNITGEVSRSDADAEQRVKVAVECRMQDRGGNELGSFREKVIVDKRDDVAKLLGLTSDLKEATAIAAVPAGAGQPDPVAAAVAADKQLKQAADNPQVSAAGGSIAATATSPYRVEILIERSPGRFDPAPITTDGGIAFVDIKPGETYAINLFNKASHDVGVELFVDGISTFELSEFEGYKKLNKWIVPRGQNFLITGWHKNNRENFKFVVTDTPDSLVAQRFPDRGTASVGTITAMFYPAWGLDEPQPKFEFGGVSRAGTGQGPKSAANLSEAVRNFGQTLLATVTVRYERPTPLDLPADAATVPAR